VSTLGQKPATQHVSTEKQSITGNGGTSYTLQQSVSQASDIEVFVNNTRQEPTVAYTANNTTLTMTGAVNSSDSFYVIFQGKAIQTAGLPVDAAITASAITASQTITSTGNITTSGTVNTPSINGGQIGGRRNMIINGAMQVAQRATSSTSDSYSTIDRYLNETNGGTTTFSQENVASGDAPFAKGFRKFHRMTNTSANTATSALRRFAQRIEAQNVACSGWNYTSTDVGLTISFWARSSIAGTYYCWLYADDSASSAIAYVPTGFALLANTWTYVTQKIKGNANLAFNNDNGSGLRVYIIAHQGTDLTSSAGSGTFDAWGAYTGTFRSGAMTQNWSHTAGSTFDITGLQVEVGEQATPFEHRSFGEELSLCQRYFYKTENTDSNYKRYAVMHVENATNVRCAFSLPTPMRAHPSLTKTGTLAIYNSGGGIVNLTSISASPVYTQSAGLGFTEVCIFAVTSSSHSSGTVGTLLSNNAAASLQFTAEL
jgi:hypothetical protein